jgi:hypothetical protein
MMGSGRPMPGASDLLGMAVRLYLSAMQKWIDRSPFVTSLDYSVLALSRDTPPRLEIARLLSPLFCTRYAKKCSVAATRYIP